MAPPPIWISIPILASLRLLGLCCSHRNLGYDQTETGTILGQAHHSNFNKMYSPNLSSGVYNCDNDGNCVLIDKYCNPCYSVPNYPPLSPPCVPSEDYGCIDDPGGAFGGDGVGGILPDPPGGFKKVQNGVGSVNYYSKPIDGTQLTNLVLVLHDLCEAINDLASTTSNMYGVGGNPGEGTYGVEPSVEAEAPEGSG
ncbi:hypothetical protein Ddye_019266 [Dipteronia dyeriana]|uniref:Uncharacterized protein n=1 Tax=Dipteronia dyeriana TaxID=168575 RepID=A0AAD9WUX0_9ROSI|nr:hypothetical protein Ddye_019266 [Dipteronia dyeriana]